MNAIKLTRKRLRELCRIHGWSEGYISLCLKGIRQMSSARAMQIEIQTNGEITRQMLRTKDYWLIWPDLPAPEATSTAGNDDLVS